VFVNRLLIDPTGKIPLVAISDSVLNNSSFQYPCSYGAVVPALLAAIFCATLAQAACDDIPPRHLVQRFFYNNSFSFLPNMSFFFIALNPKA